MVPEVAEFLYKIALEDGFDGPIEEFVDTVSKRPEAFDKVYEYAQNTGFDGSIDSFKEHLFGVAEKVPINSGLIPINENTSIRELPADDGKMRITSKSKPVDPPKYLVNTDEVLYKIYDSPGGTKRRENEYTESFKVVDSDIDKTYYRGHEYTPEELVKIKKQRVATTPVTETHSEEGDDSYEGGFMRRKFAEEFPNKEWGSREEYQKAYDEYWAKEHPINTEIQLSVDNFKKAPLKSNDYPAEDYRSDLIAVATEEKEHSTHVPLTSEKGDPNYNSLITPFVAKLAKDNTVIKDDYLDDPTEVVAKKRATEVNLMGRGLLGAGEDVTETHFKELLANDNLPFNVIQLLMAVSGVDYDDAGAKETLKKVQKELLNNPTLYKESLSRWLNLMNKIAFNQKDDGTFMV